MENQKKKRNVLKITLNIVFYLIIIFMFVFSISSIQRKKEDELPHLFGNAYMPIVTDSMEGNLKDSLMVGDLALVKLLDDAGREQLEVGDIIVFYRSSRFIIHRIIDGYQTESGDVYLITKGDNTAENEVDGPVDLSRVIAVYSGNSVPAVGNAIIFLQTPTGFAVGILLPVALILIYYGVLMVANILAINKEKLALEFANKAEESKVDLEAEKEKIRQQILEELKKEQEK